MISNRSHCVFAHNLDLVDTNKPRLLPMMKGRTSASLSRCGLVVSKLLFALCFLCLPRSGAADGDTVVCCGQKSSSSCDGPFEIRSEGTCTGCAEAEGDVRGCTERCVADFAENCSTLLPIPSTLPPIPTPYPTPPPTCDECEVDLEAIDIPDVTKKIMEVGQTFMDYYTLVLDEIDCTKENAVNHVRDCEMEVTLQKQAMEKFNTTMYGTMNRLEAMDCMRQTSGIAIEPTCVFPRNDTEGDVESDFTRMLHSFSRSVDTSPGYHHGRSLFESVASEPSCFAENFCELIVEEDLPEDVADRIRDISIAEGVVDAAQEIDDALPSCGGFFTGDGCSAGVTAAKIGFVIAIVAARSTLRGLTTDLELRQLANAGISFDYTAASHNNILVVNNKINQVLCPFGEDGPDAVFAGQGCDSVDQDCDCEIDECDEDRLKPTIELTVPIPETPFGSLEDAKAFLEANVVVDDDCATELISTISDPAEGLDCMETCTFTARVEDARCFVNDIDTPDAFNEEAFVLEVDSTPADITCGFYIPQDPWHVAEDVEFDPCLGIAPPFPVGDDILHIDGANFDEECVNVNFWFQVDNGDEPIDVTIEVQSNELVSLDPSLRHTQAVVLEKKDRSGGVDRANVFLSPTSCHDEDGRGSTTKGCLKDPAEGVTTRIYDIVLSAVDEAGNKSSKTCSVIVVPCGHYCSSSGSGKGKGNGGEGVVGGNGGRKLNRNRRRTSRGLDDVDRSSDGGKGKGRMANDNCVGLHNSTDDFNDLRMEYNISTMRYVIDSIVVEWDPELDTTPIPEPDLPEFDLCLCNEDNDGKGKGSSYLSSREGSGRRNLMSGNGKGKSSSCNDDEDRPDICVDCPTCAPVGKGKGKGEDEDVEEFDAENSLPEMIPVAGQQPGTDEGAAAVEDEEEDAGFLQKLLGSEGGEGESAATREKTKPNH